MAKKTITISRKPTADTSAPVESEPPVTSSALALNWEPPSKALPESPEAQVATTPFAYTPFDLAVYAPAFYLSYGLAFSTIMMSAFIPGSGLIRQGIHDGVHAAQRGFKP
jgi:hypothetical protein